MKDHEFQRSSQDQILINNLSLLYIIQRRMSYTLLTFYLKCFLYFTFQLANSSVHRLTGATNLLILLNYMNIISKNPWVKYLCISLNLLPSRLRVLFAKSGKDT